MKRILSLCVALVLLCAFYAEAQTSSDELSPAQILRSARAIYDQGRLHELPPVLERAISLSGKNKFSQSEKIEAYKLLILTYIYLEEPQKADAKMIEMLRTDHFFTPIDSDPVEFRSLYKKFRTISLFRIGFKLGLGQTHINVIKNYYMTGQGNGEYIPNISLHFGAVFEKDFKKKFVINPEVFFTTQSFNYKNEKIYFWDRAETETGNAVANHKIVQKRMQLNLLMQYKINEGKFFPYVALGPAIGYLTNSSFEGDLAPGGRAEHVTGSTIVNKVKYQKLNLSGMAVAGMRFKMSGIFIAADIRYQYGLFNAVNKEQRNINDTPELNELFMRYNYVDNDFSINQAMFNVGIIYPFYSPKKIIK
jgi:hypothetical protein